MNHDRELVAASGDGGSASPLSKRDFLKITGIAALGLPGLTRAAGKDDRWDLIVVGGGNAGL
ncbi:MAG: hypothetical protein IT481_01615, partial [Gammaproteobacteria bacterium]|nr:hypothetical protein [Gammaproteobacteria bacterium]